VCSALLNLTAQVVKNHFLIIYARNLLRMEQRFLARGEQESWLRSILGLDSPATT
jgi:hypothetical protein